MQSLSIKIKSRGRVTIPKKIRDMMLLEEGQIVSMIPMGNSIVISMKGLDLDEARKKIQRIVRQSGCSVDELMSGLHDERKALYQELWSNK